MNIDRIIWTPVERDIIARIVWAPLIILLLCLITITAPAIEVGDIVLRHRIATSGREESVKWRNGFSIVNGLLVLNAPVVEADDISGFIPFSKLTDLPPTLAGHGITSFETDSFILTDVTDSLAENQRGLGRVGGRDTGQLGGGTLQWYQSGADKIMAWSGKIQAASMDLTSVSIFTAVPSGPTAAGEAGQMAVDENFIYVCVALNTWKRAALSSW